jgi:hypothetical protein
MSGQEKLVAVISPWEKLSDLVKRGFRVESLPAEKKIMVWRDDLQTEKELTGTLSQIGISSVEVQKKRVTAKWQDVQ